MTNKDFMEIERAAARGEGITYSKTLLVIAHARELQQKVFCGDMLAKAIQEYLIDKDSETIPEKLVVWFHNYTQNKPVTKLPGVEAEAQP